jgi:hypothetical protein
MGTWDGAHDLISLSSGSLLTPVMYGARPKIRSAAEKPTGDVHVSYLLQVEIFNAEISRVLDKLLG